MYNTDEYWKKDCSSLWHPYTRRSSIRNGPFPLITRGEGLYLFDSDGNRYLDAISSWWACNLGHGHPRIVEAIKCQAGKLQHSILGNLSHPRAIELAEELSSLVSGRAARVLFASDGASAVEAALRIAVQYWHNAGMPQKKKFVSFEIAYHGDTMGAVSVGYMPEFHKHLSSMTFETYRAEAPCCGTCRHGQIPSNCELQCFRSMQKILDGHSDEIAGVLVEPLCQGAAGMRMYSPRYLKKLAECCNTSDVLLIDDEIAMGFGRTGRMFAFEHAEIEPDIVCLGKGLSGGYLPISAAVVRETIYETFDDKDQDRTFYHGHTFGGNPIACAAALAVLQVYEEDGIVAKAAAMAELLKSALDKFQGLSFVRDIRCLGLIGALELSDQEGGLKGTEFAQKVRDKMLVNKILLRPLGNVLYLMPPLITPADALCDLVSALYEAVNESL